ncbi:MAG: T9SS type A sorting domain-containing protein, partial [Bacteroidota bacterium]
FNLSGFPSNKEVWVTEFNLLESASGVPQIISHTWTHVLFNTAMNHFFLGKSNVSMVLNHSLAGDNHFQSISRQDKKITANALSMKLLYDMSRGSQSCQNINFSGNPAIIYGTTTIPKLVGWKFNFSGMEKGFICNLSKDTFAVSLGSIFANTMQFDQYNADTNLVVNGISSLNKYSGSSSDTIIVYPYSITQINSTITTGIPNIESSKNELWIYPNPANGNISIRTEKNLNNANVFIYDISGKEVNQLNKISGNSFSLSIDKLIKGVYFVNIISGNNITTGKFIID